MAVNGYECSLLIANCRAVYFFGHGGGEAAAQDGVAGRQQGPGRPGQAQAGDHVMDTEDG